MTGNPDTEVALGLPARRARARHYPLTAFPRSFVDELEQYLHWLGDPGNGTDRTYSASTIKQRRTELRLAAAALAEVSANPGSVSALRQLVVPGNAETILEAYFVNGEPTSFVRTLATNLIALARQWVKPSPDELTQLVVLRHQLGNTHVELAKKTQRLLRELQDPGLREALLALPSALASHVRRGRLPPAQQRQPLRTAVAIEVLLHTGLRLNQLATLRLGQHLTWPDGPHGALHIHAPGRRSRDGAAQQFELAGAPQALLQEYVDRFAAKPTRHHPHPLIFTNAGGTPVTASALADGIRKATLRGIGRPITPHQLRHYCATLILDTYPDDYTTVKDLLGHQFLESTLALYGGGQRHRAGAQWNAFIQQAEPMLR